MALKPPVAWTGDHAVDIWALIDHQGDFFNQDQTIEQQGTNRTKWKKYTAHFISLTGGTSSDTVADLQTAHDGNFYHITEQAVTPGQNLIVDFDQVTAFNRVEIIGIYDGGATHAIGIQLYHWAFSRWDTFGSFQNAQEDVTSPGEYVLENKSFWPADTTQYIGTGTDVGKVRVRLHHTAAGNVSHDTYIDVIALYQ